MSLKEPALYIMYVYETKTHALFAWAGWGKNMGLPLLTIASGDYITVYDYIITKHVHTLLYLF